MSGKPGSKIGYRTCKKCGESKPTEDYGFFSTGTRKTTCSTCTPEKLPETPCDECGKPTRSIYGACHRTAKCKALAQLRRHHTLPENRSSELLYYREWTRSNQERQLWLRAKTRAAKRGIPFSISVEDIVIPEHCPVLGMKLAITEGKPGQGSPSLDQIIPGKGYVPGNIQVISNLANTMKSNASEEQLTAFVKYYFNVLGLE